MTVNQAMSNTHEEIKRIHGKLWLGIFGLLLVRVLTIGFLTSGASLWAIVLDYLLLVPIYWYITQPLVIEAILVWSAFTAIKNENLEMEESLTKAGKAINNIILTAFVCVFIAPDTIALLFNGIKPSVALLVLGLGIGCGILTVILKWEGKFFFQLLFATNIAIIVTALLPGINFGPNETMRKVTDIVLEFRWLVGFLVFLAVLGILEAVFKTATEKGGSLVKKVWNAVAWILHPWNFFKALIGAIILYIILSVVYPQAVIWIADFLQRNQAEATKQAAEKGISLPHMQALFPAKSIGPSVSTQRSIPQESGKVFTKTCAPRWEKNYGWCQFNIPAGSYTVAFTQSTVRRDYSNGTWDNFGLEGIPLATYERLGHQNNNTEMLAYHDRLSKELPDTSKNNGVPLVKVEGKVYSHNESFSVTEPTTLLIGINNVEQEVFWEGISGQVVLKLQKTKQ